MYQVANKLLNRKPSVLPCKTDFPSQVHVSAQSVAEMMLDSAVFACVPNTTLRSGTGVETAL